MHDIRRQRGYALWVILLVCIAAVAGAKWWHDKSKQQRVDEAAARERNITAERAAQERREREAQMVSEKREFEARLSAERARSEYDKSADALRSIQTRWAEAHRVAGVTSRVALAGPVSTLQEIRRDAAALVLPSCLQGAQKKLLEGMQWQLDGYIAFMADVNIGKTIAEGSFKAGEALISEARSDAERCAQQPT